MPAGPIQFANAAFTPAQVAGPIQFANAAFTPAQVAGPLQFAYANFLQGVQGEPVVGLTVTGEEFPAAGVVSGELVN
jgi:hypothetical protein